MQHDPEHGNAWHNRTKCCADVAASVANVGTDARADGGADSCSHSRTDGAADPPSADSCPNCDTD